MYRHRIEALRKKKLKSRVALLRRLAGSRWKADTKTLRMAALSLLYSTSVHCSPVWCRSGHTRLIASLTVFLTTSCALPLDSASHTNELFANRSKYPTSTALSTRSNSLPGIWQCDGSQTPLYQLMVGLTTAHEERLRSREPFVPAARKLLNELSKLSICAAQSINCKWDAKFSAN